MSSLASQYSKFDALYDSDEERERDEAAKRKQKAQAQRQQMQARRMAAAQAASGGSAAEGEASSSTAAATSDAAGPAPMMAAANELDVSKMTDSQREAFLENYAQIFNKNRAAKAAAKYKFPDTLEEQRVICEAADELRVRGNALYKEGSIVEAAKLYEQAVLKFGDWCETRARTRSQNPRPHRDTSRPARKLAPASPLAVAQRRTARASTPALAQSPCARHGQACTCPLAGPLAPPAAEPALALGAGTPNALRPRRSGSRCTRSSSRRTSTSPRAHIASVRPSFASRQHASHLLDVVTHAHVGSVHARTDRDSLAFVLALTPHRSPRPALVDHPPRCELASS